VRRKAESYELLGVAAGCNPEELAAAYRRTIGQWHPDKVETMAQGLRDYATRRTARINEAYESAPIITKADRSVTTLLLPDEY